MMYTYPENLHLDNVTRELPDSTFFNDVIEGLSSYPKYLQSKYFYDQAGDALFQQIMNLPEYYPAACEMEIFSRQCGALTEALTKGKDDFDLIELGAGDATKTHFLLECLIGQQIKFTYKPIDISENIIGYLTATLPVLLPGIKIEGLNGDYIDMLKKATASSTKRKVVLLLGSNIGNMSIPDATKFCTDIRNTLSPGDMLLVGVDLKKHPAIILAAYNDSEGVTERFNLNLLSRINQELSANFDISSFDHFPAYDPLTGACKSFLVSQKNQTVQIGAHSINFLKDEIIDMEVSQKYALEEIRVMARKSGFNPITDFFDEKRWFLDTLWIVSEP